MFHGLSLISTYTFTLAYVTIILRIAGYLVKEMLKVPNIYTELTGFIKGNSLDFERLKSLTNLEFAKKIQERYDDDFTWPYNTFFKVGEKKGTNSLGHPIHHIFVSVGNRSFSHHYMFDKNAPIYNEWKVIVNQEFFENVVRPFQNNISKVSNLSHVIGVEEAAELWNLSPSHIKTLCANNKIKAKRVGKTWIIDKDQPHPSIK